MNSPGRPEFIGSKVPPKVGCSKKKHSHHTIKRRPINESAIKHKTKRIVILPQKGKFTIKIRR
jgi:hypothetical protein